MFEENCLSAVTTGQHSWQALLSGRPSSWLCLVIPDQAVYFSCLYREHWEKAKELKMFSQNIYTDGGNGGRSSSKTQQPTKLILQVVAVGLIPAAAVVSVGKILHLTCLLVVVRVQAIYHFTYTLLSWQSDCFNKYVKKSLWNMSFTTLTFPEWCSLHHIET